MTTVINGSSPSITFSDSTTQTTAFTTTPVINTINSQASTPLTLGINGTEAMRIDSSGNVLVNSATLPTALNTNFKNIYVKGANNGVVAVSSNDGLASVTLYSGASSSDNPAIAFQNSLRFATATDVGIGGFAERMRITSGGNLLVGTTTASGKITAYYDVGTNCSFATQTGSNNYVGVNFLNASNAQAGYIYVSSASVTYNTTSDYRLKENVAPMTGALAKVQALKPVTYTWKADGSNSQGFIAHELQAVVPDCVTGEKDGVDEEGNPKYQGVDTSFLVATLTAAIQEQQALIESLTTRLIALESK